MIFMIVVFMFPASPNPTAENMNYTIVVVGGTILLSLVYYYLPGYGGKHWFTGPVHTIEEHAGSSASAKDSDGSSQEKV